MLLASHLYQSWMTPTYESDWLVESSLVDDVFGTTSEYCDKCYVDASCYHCIVFQNLVTTHDMIDYTILSDPFTRIRND